MKLKGLETHPRLVMLIHTTNSDFVKSPFFADVGIGGLYFALLFTIGHGKLFIYSLGKKTKISMSIKVSMIQFRNF